MSCDTSILETNLYSPSVPSHDYTDRRDKKLMSISNSKNSRHNHGTMSSQVTPGMCRSDAPQFWRSLHVYRQVEEDVSPVWGNDSSNSGSGKATAPTSLSSSSITTPPSNLDALPTLLRPSSPYDNNSEERPLDPISSPSPLPIDDGTVTSQVAETRCSICGSSCSESSEKCDTSQSQQPHTDGGDGGGGCVFCNDKDEQIGIAI